MKKQELLQLGEMLQSMMQDLEVDAIAQVVAETAIASALATEDPQKRAQLEWYAKQFRRLAAGPPADLGFPAGPRATGREALEHAFVKLVLRVNRLRDTPKLAVSDREWLEEFGRELGRVATWMEGAG
jgi:hypothetical protein